MQMLKRLRGDDGAKVLAPPLFNRLGDEIENIFERSLRNFGRWPWTETEAFLWPTIDVIEKEKDFILRIDVPGVDPKQLDVQLKGDQLVITGTREEEKEEKDQNLLRRERQFGTFMRSIVLPTYVDPKEIDARYEKGVLTVTMHKVAGQVARHITVKAQ
jgi:HSP20 family protein